MRRRPVYDLRHPARELPPSPTGSGSGGDQDENSSSTLEQKESKKHDGKKHVTFGAEEYFGYIQDEEENGQLIPETNSGSTIGFSSPSSRLKKVFCCILFCSKRSGETR